MFDSPEATATRTHRDEFSPQVKVQWWYLPWNVVKLALRPEVKEKPWIKYATKQSGTLEPSNKWNQNIAVKREEFRSSSCHHSSSSEPLYRYWKKMWLTIYKSFGLLIVFRFFYWNHRLVLSKTARFRKEAPLKNQLYHIFWRNYFVPTVSCILGWAFDLSRGRRPIEQLKVLHKSLTKHFAFTSCRSTQVPIRSSEQTDIKGIVFGEPHMRITAIKCWHSTCQSAWKQCPKYIILTCFCSMECVTFSILGNFRLLLDDTLSTK